MGCSLDLCLDGLNHFNSYKLLVSGKKQKRVNGLGWYLCGVIGCVGILFCLKGLL